MTVQAQEQPVAVNSYYCFARLYITHAELAWTQANKGWV